MKLAWKKITTLLFLTLLIFFTQTGSAFAGGSIWDCAAATDKDRPPSFACLPSVVKNIIDGLLFFSGTVAMVFIVFAGIKYLLSRGDPKQIEGAKHTLTYAIIGLIVVLSVFLILHFLEYITGVPLNFPTFPEPELPPTPTP